MTNCDCTIIVPALNEAKYIGGLFDSIDRQTVTPAQVIVVDDNSEDATKAICEERGAIVLQSDRSGIAKSRSVGFEAAKTEFIVSNDADSSIVPLYIKVVQDALHAHPEAVAVFGPVYLSDGPAWLRLLSRTAFTWFLKLSIILGKPNLNGQNFACRSIAYNEVGGFDLKARTAEDVALGQRLKKVGKIVFIPEMIVYTSARRITGMGAGKFLLHHTRNYLRTLTGRTGLDDFKPYR